MPREPTPLVILERPCTKCKKPNQEYYARESHHFYCRQCALEVNRIRNKETRTSKYYINVAKPNTMKLRSQYVIDGVQICVRCRKPGNFQAKNGKYSSTMCQTCRDEQNARLPRMENETMSARQIRLLQNPSLKRRIDVIKRMTVDWKSFSPFLEAVDVELLRHPYDDTSSCTLQKDATWQMCVLADYGYWYCDFNGVVTCGYSCSPKLVWPFFRLDGAPLKWFPVNLSEQDTQKLLDRLFDDGYSPVLVSKSPRHFEPTISFKESEAEKLDTSIFGVVD